MQFGKPSKLPDGRYFLKMSQEDGGRVIHQLNKVTIDIPADTTQLSISVPSEQTLFFSDLDEKIVSQAKTSKVEWFGKEISDDTVTAAYQKSINPESELSVSLVTVKGKVTTTAYDSQKNQIDVSAISGTPVDVLLELIGLVFTKRTFEPVWKLLQARLVKVRRPPTATYMFKDEDDPESPDDEPDV
jgi:hypothetical protein